MLLLTTNDGPALTPANSPYRCSALTSGALTRQIPGSGVPSLSEASFSRMRNSPGTAYLRRRDLPSGRQTPSDICRQLASFVVKCVLNAAKRHLRAVIGEWPLAAGRSVKARFRICCSCRWVLGLVFGKPKDRQQVAAVITWRRLVAI